MSKAKESNGQFNGIYEELAQLIGIDPVIKIYNLYQGQQITFPKRLFSQEFVESQILQKCHDSQDIKAIAIKFGYTERWVRSVIQKHVKEESEENFT